MCQGDPPVRLVTVEVDGHTLQIIGLDIEAELIALIYHYRWQVELFFKWLKCILGCSHLLADSSSGVTIQVYCALIGALMLQMLTGRRPSKREMELIRFYMVGMMGPDELMALLAKKRDRIQGLEQLKARAGPRSKSPGRHRQCNYQGATRAQILALLPCCQRSDQSAPDISHEKSEPLSACPTP